MSSPLTTIEMNIPTACVDYRDCQVLVPPAVITHVSNRHPEMRDHLERICEVLGTPNFVYFRQRNDSYLFYKLGVLSGSISRNYLVIIVRYGGGNGLVKTLYSTGRPAYGDQLVYMAER